MNRKESQYTEIIFDYFHRARDSKYSKGVSVRKYSQDVLGYLPGYLPGCLTRVVLALSGLVPWVPQEYIPYYTRL